MKLEVKGNINYCATIVGINNIITLEGCDNIQATTILGNHVIISKDTQVGDIGIFFPVECSIKEVFLKANSLYRDKELNEDKEKAGFFENKGRVKCIKFRGYKSEGFFIPIESLFWIVKDLDVSIGTDFDHIDDVMICEKYVVKSNNQNSSSSKNSKTSKKIKRFNKLKEEQFRFHIDTAPLAKNIHMIKPDSIISITGKLHGTSAIASYILCNRKLSFKDKVAKFFGIKIQENEYDYIHASRKVVKNQYLYEDKQTHYYSEDIWKVGAEELKPFLQKGMTIYYEIVGFLKDGGYIQKGFDYGCDNNKHENYIYRITTTNEDGRVVEWSMLQVQQWCKQNGLEVVPLYYYGRARNLFSDTEIERDWQRYFLEFLQEKYLEKKCSICKNNVPDEGICLRVESLDIDVYKLKSFLFRVYESKTLDLGESNIEDNQVEE